MLSISDLKTLREAYSASSELTVEQARRQIGDPADETIVASAVAQMSHADRNRRVLALRVLEHQAGGRAARAVLAGMVDEKRRVRQTAIQACPNYLAHEAVVARLEAIARDRGEKRKLRRRALSMLAGNEGRLQGDLTAAASAALRRLMADEAYRFAILFGLARLELTRRVKALLEAFAVSADAAARGLAQRALGGERVIHIDGYAADKEMRQRIMQTCEIAHGRMYYWLPRAGGAAEPLVTI